MYSREQLSNDLRRLGVEAGDTVMVHASVRAAGWPDQIQRRINQKIL